ncbi:hypothetical protein CDAR_417911 [Caerostris darwini]|uniref:Cation/H+ exchanger transmembrane domain-containing protein n=1 Tax=Caerostris darwini TaxID=1538125 RepID=A0AAV4MG22_9ARAC|nr:hypothetical protein CDAR_417911 [Caerostris darwini]
MLCSLRTLLLILQALCLVARALTVFPLSIFVNFFREHEITAKMMFIMWYSAIRGAVTFALALRFDFEEEKRNVIITTTLVIVLFTTIIFGGSTIPLLKCLQKRESIKKKKEDCQSEICLIKTEKLDSNFGALFRFFIRNSIYKVVKYVMGKHIGRLVIEGETIDASEAEEADLKGPRNWFAKFDADYLKPLFTVNKMDCEYGMKTQDFEFDWRKYVKGL